MGAALRRAVPWLLVGLGAVLLARAVVVVHAEAAFRRGAGYTRTPARDEPGRLEAYEEAVRRLPGDFTYRLRAGQIRLRRATGGMGDENLLRAADHLDAALDAFPLDARARLSVAQLRLAEGDVAASLDAVRTAVRLGPRHDPVARGAVSVALDQWWRGRDVEALRLALETERDRRTWSSNPKISRPDARAFRAARQRLLPDILEAAAGDPDLLRTGATWLDAIDRPDDAELLRRAAARREGRRP